VIRYTRSVPGVASEPAAHEWSSLLFERTKSQIPGAPEAPPTYTYPQFDLVGDDVLLTWRDGSSDNGRQALLRYDENAAGTWSFLGRFTDNLGGTYDGGFGSSTSRYGYIHGFTADPASGDLAITLSWREQTSAWCPGTEAVGNHDLGYAVSGDGGLTWQNNAGATVATTTTGDTAGTITPFSPGIVVEPIGINTGLINQEIQAFDSEGQLHVVTSRVPDEDLGPDGCADNFYPDRAALARPYHHWREARGNLAHDAPAVPQRQRRADQDRLRLGRQRVRRPPRRPDRRRQPRQRMDRLAARLRRPRGRERQRADRRPSARP
jgi:BNR repeat-containing family member